MFASGATEVWQVAGGHLTSDRHVKRAEEFDDWHAGGSWSFTHSRRVIASDAKYHNIPWLPKRKRERERARRQTCTHRQINKLLVCLFYLSSEYFRIIWRKRKRKRNGGNQIKWLLSPERDDTTRVFSASPLGLVSHCPRLHRDIKPDNMVLQVLLGFVLPTMLPHLLQPSSAQHTNWAEIFYGLKVLSLKLHTGAYAAATRTAQ